MINKVILIGRLTRDAELRKTATNKSVASFTLAVDNRTASKEEKTTSFIPCTAWGMTADNLCKFTRKGSLVAVEGRVNQRSYEDKDKRNVQVVEIICDVVQFLDNKSASTVATQQVDTSVLVDESKSPLYEEPRKSSIDIVDDDLPF